MILTNDTVHRDQQGVVSGFTRQNYVAIFAVEDVSFDPNTGLKFRITGRLSDLQQETVARFTPSTSANPLPRPQTPSRTSVPHIGN